MSAGIVVVDEIPYPITWMELKGGLLKIEVTIPGPQKKRTINGYKIFGNDGTLIVDDPYPWKCPKVEDGKKTILDIAWKIKAIEQGEK